MESLQRQGYAEPLKAYIASGKPYMGICIGMQALFESSTEAPGIAGLGIVPGQVDCFTPSESKTVPQMGWNTARSLRRDAASFGFSVGDDEAQHFYFVHSYRAALDATKHNEWALTTTQYGDEVFLSSVSRGNVFATQFHPEKSGRAGLEVLRAWLDRGSEGASKDAQWLVDLEDASRPRSTDGLTKRIVACLDVRSNDEGDVVVTKGESYDVREKARQHQQQQHQQQQQQQQQSTAAASSSGQRAVRNLGKPVDLAMRYYLEGADEVVFLNITSFRNSPLKDQPMLAVVAAAAESVFVPLTIGGGIKDSVDPDGTRHSAREVADEYFRAGADKVSIGSEAVLAVEDLLANGGTKTGQTGIETISLAYGKQAVVVSIDPRRVYLEQEEHVEEKHRPSVVERDGKRWWYRCTIKGGREDRDIDVVQLAKGVESLGAGEILVNSIDQDGKGQGFDRDLIDLVRASVRIPVVASSGAGLPVHFRNVFEPKPLARATASTSPPTSVEAALAAGVFHRKEMTIDEVKQHLADGGFKVRRERTDQGAAKAVQEATARGVKAD